MLVKQLTAGLAASALLATVAFAQTPTTTADRMAPPAATSNASHQGDWRASKLVGLSVYNNNNESIGSINDLLTDKSGNIKAVVIGVGGFLGVGEKNVAVPFQALKVAEKNGKRYLVLDTTKEALQTAPGYSYDHSKNVWLPATKQG
jgi:sporulation protein YlmC with PRC-barrel domain